MSLSPKGSFTLNNIEDCTMMTPIDSYDIMHVSIEE